MGVGVGGLLKSSSTDSPIPYCCFDDYDLDPFSPSAPPHPTSYSNWQSKILESSDFASEAGGHNDHSPGGPIVGHPIG